MSTGAITGAIFSIGARAGLSAYTKIPWKTAALYNSVDMLVSGFVSKIMLERHDEQVDALGTILVSRVIGIVAGLLVTRAVLGPLDPLVALALNVASLFAFALLRNGDPASRRIVLDPDHDHRNQNSNLFL